MPDCLCYVSRHHGSRKKIDARWTTIWEKRGTSWIIVHEHLSTPPPPVSCQNPPYRRVSSLECTIAAFKFIQRTRTIKDSEIGESATLVDGSGCVVGNPSLTKNGAITSLEVIPPDSCYQGLHIVESTTKKQSTAMTATITFAF
jgi:hypothetical protein